MRYSLSIHLVARWAFLLLLSQPLLAQSLRVQDSTKRITHSALIKTNVAGPFSLFLEIPVMPRRSVQLSTQWITLNLFSRTRFFNLTADYRFYLGKVIPTTLRPAPRGFYLSPYVKYRTVADEHNGNTSGATYSTITYSMLGGGLVAGSQFINRWGLTIDGFLGIGYFPIIGNQLKIDIPTYSPPQPKPQDYQLDIRLGLCIGLAF